jgi:hypothetical protein
MALPRPCRTGRSPWGSGRQRHWAVGVQRSRRSRRSWWTDDRPARPVACIGRQAPDTPVKSRHGLERKLRSAFAKEMIGQQIPDPGRPAGGYDPDAPRVSRARRCSDGRAPPTAGSAAGPADKRAAPGEARSCRQQRSQATFASAAGRYRATFLRLADGFGSTSRCAAFSADELPSRSSMLPICTALRPILPRL